MHFFSDNLNEAKLFAEKALKICEKLKKEDKNDYWIQATEAEAFLINGLLTSLFHLINMQCLCRMQNLLGSLVLGSKHSKLPLSTMMIRYSKI